MTADQQEAYYWYKETHRFIRNVIYSSEDLYQRLVHLDIYIFDRKMNNLYNTNADVLQAFKEFEDATSTHLGALKSFLSKAIGQTITALPQETHDECSGLPAEVFDSIKHSQRGALKMIGYHVHRLMEVPWLVKWHATKYQEILRDNHPNQSFRQRELVMGSLSDSESAYYIVQEKFFMDTSTSYADDITTLEWLEHQKRLLKVMDEFYDDTSNN